MESFNNVLNRINRVTQRLEEFICLALLVAMTIVIFIQIVFRFAKMPLLWSEELARIMFIWLIYISVCVATQRKAHLCVDILPIIVKGEKGQVVIEIVSNIVCLLFFVFVAYFGVGVLKMLLGRPQYSAAMHLNMFWAYLGPYLGAGLASIHYIIFIIQDFQQLFKPAKGGEK